MLQGKEYFVIERSNPILTYSHIKSALKQAKLGFVIAYINCQFKFPLTYPDNIIIATKVEKLSKDRFTLSQIIYSETHQKVAAKSKSKSKSKSIIVSFSHKMQSKINLSNAAFTLLEKELTPNSE